MVTKSSPVRYLMLSLNLYWSIYSEAPNNTGQYCLYKLDDFLDQHVLKVFDV